MFAGKKSAQIREILISESAWEEMTCLFAPSLIKEQSYYISSEKDFLDFIRDAETAFSREHTQWQARR
ncbi:hypothetical protein AB8R75_29520, partial [Klebsiella quasipneumoniae subsp. similipneumoniae]